MSTPSWKPEDFVLYPPGSVMCSDQSHPQPSLKTPHRPTIEEQFFSLESTWSVSQYRFFSPTSAAKHNQPHMDLNQFDRTPHFRTLGDIVSERVSTFPISLMGCGRDPATKKKLLDDQFFASEYTFLENVHWKDLVEMIDSGQMPVRYRNHCTIVLANRPAHIYFDFDAKASPSKPQNDAMFQRVKDKERLVQIEVLQMFNQYFNSVFKRQPNLVGMHWETASTAVKFSLHAHIITEAFVNIGEMKLFMAGFSQFVRETASADSLLCVKHPNQHGADVIVSLMDDSVYTKNRSFRLIGCCKPGGQALRWMPNPEDDATKAAPSMPELIFRGLISHAIDVDSAQLLTMPKESLSETSKNTAKKKAATTDAGKTPTIKSEDGKQVLMSSMASTVVERILRDGLLGEKAEVATCTYRNYGEAWSIVGHCVKGTAWCPLRTNYSTNPIQPEIHSKAVTNFSITATRIKLWDWKCGQDEANTKVLPLHDKYKATIKAVLKEVHGSVVDDSDSTESEELATTPTPVSDSTNRKRKADCLYQEFDDHNPHEVDLYQIKDTRPESETIQRIVAAWEAQHGSRVKKWKAKYQDRHGKGVMAEKLNNLRSSLLSDVVKYLNLYWKLSTRMPEPLVLVRLIEEQPDERREWKIDYMSPKSFEMSYNYLVIKSSLLGQEIKIPKMWLEHIESARFDTIQFEPIPDGVAQKRPKYAHFNLWKGFKISANESQRFVADLGRQGTIDSLRPFLQHIMKVWCRNEQSLYDYVINWMAWGLQRPNQKIGVSIVIRGDKGSGKGIVVQALGRIYGKEYFFHAQTAGDVVGDFNDHLSSCLLCFLDEVYLEKDKAATNKLKAMITEKETVINTKFKSKFSLPSYKNFILAGNDEKLVECEGNERRFLALETDDQWSGSQTQVSAEYFKKIGAVSTEALRYFLSRRELSDFNPRSIPSSKALRDQKLLSLSPFQMWLHHSLVRGSVLDPEDTTYQVATTPSDDHKSEIESLWDQSVQKSHVFSSFMKFSKVEKLEEGKFWKNLYETMRPAGAKKTLIYERRQMIKLAATTRQQMMIHFPSLNEARRMFKEKVVHENDWSFEPTGEVTARDQKEADDTELGLSALAHV